MTDWKGIEGTACSVISDRWWKQVILLNVMVVSESSNSNKNNYCQNKWQRKSDLCFLPEKKGK